MSSPSPTSRQFLQLINRPSVDTLEETDVLCGTATKINFSVC